MISFKDMACCEKAIDYSFSVHLQKLWTMKLHPTYVSKSMQVLSTTCALSIKIKELRLDIYSP